MSSKMHEPRFNGGCEIFRRALADLYQVTQRAVKAAPNAVSCFARDLEGEPHQLERERNESILPRGQLDGADVEGADLAEGPAFEKPFGAEGSAAFERLASGAPVPPVGAELDVV